MQFSDYLYTKKEPEGIPWDIWRRWRMWLPSGCCMILRMTISIPSALRKVWTRSRLHGLNLTSNQESRNNVTFKTINRSQTYLSEVHDRIIQKLISLFVLMVEVFH